MPSRSGCGRSWRQYRCFRTVADALAAEGARIRDWSELAPAEHTSLERWFAENVAPVLTPKALTRAPGHSFPHLGDRRLSLAVLLRDGPDGPLHFEIGRASCRERV